MKNISSKMIAVFVSTLLIVSMLAILPIHRATATADLPDYEAVDWQTGLAGKVEMPTIEDDLGAMEASAATIESFTSTPAVGTKVWDWYLRAISRGTVTGNQPWMTLRAISGNVEVWVQDYLWFPPGDPRNNYDGGYALTITDEMVQYLVDEFNNVIYPSATTYFGQPFNRDGSGNIFIGLNYPSPPPSSPSNWWEWIFTDNPQRVILKVLNIRDTNYYDSTYPYYVAGFFSSTYTRTYYKRNMIHIDAWRWWQRLGAAGKQWFPERPDLVNTRSHLYESVTVHEFQHNIHRDWNPNDDTFMNEGASDYSQILAGYPETIWGHVNSYLYTPDNSLTVWSDQGDINILADYGAALLWVVYLADHYGGADFIRHFVQAGIPGIAGINHALAYYGYAQTFDDVFYDWRIANLIHTNLVADGRYNYMTIDLGGPDATPAFRHTISGLPVPRTKGTDFGTTKTNLGYDTGVAMLGPYSSDYIVMDKWDNMGIIYFDGDDTAAYGWTRTADGWWSNGANLMNTLLYVETYVNPANPTLEIVTKYDIENLWDFGFVQVSTDGGNTWVSLSNAYTTSSHDPGAHPDIVANLPGLTGKSTGWPAWFTMTFDLTAYAGQTVRIGFRYMTDWATLGAGWYINGASVSGVSVIDTLIPMYPEADFQVSVVRVYTQGGAVVKYLVNDMELADASETGTKGARVPDPNYVILVVSPINQKGLVDYTFWAKSLPIRGDVNGDGVVNIGDVGQVSAHWYPGPPLGVLGYDPNFDINLDGATNIAEVGIVSADWGKSW